MGCTVRRALLIASALVLCAPGGKRKKPEVVAVEPAPPPEPPKPALPVIDPLFPSSLPFPEGPLPRGLANSSAQGCNACHYAQHDGWAGSAHATGASGEAFLAAVRDAGTSTCLACHLPLLSQHPEQVVASEDDPGTTAARPNPSFDATMRTEGVTCAACHVREGAIVGTGSEGPAPHPFATSPDLGSVEMCAACHQLSWPGSNRPFYDTVGEWERSPHASAGVRCVDCHMGPGAGDASHGADHAFPAPAGRAVSLLVRMDRIEMARGGEPLSVEIRLQNTGAGHAFPTGSPFRAVVLRARLEGPPEKKSREPTVAAELVERLARTLDATSPWNTLEDTRLEAGGERIWAWNPAIGSDAPPGDWDLVVTLAEEIRGVASTRVLLERRIPLDVD